MGGAPIAMLGVQVGGFRAMLSSIESFREAAGPAIDWR
jgi:hypothetical protein